MPEKEKITVIKIFIAGEGGVGKTTLVERLTKDRFVTDTILTIGVQHTLHNMISKSGKKYVFQIWDLGGEDRFKFIVPMYVKGSSGGIIVFDESRYPTYKNLPDWIELVKKDYNPKAPLILISTKSDLIDTPLMSEDEKNDLLTRYNLTGYYRTSSKSGFNVKDLFRDLLEIIIRENY